MTSTIKRKPRQEHGMYKHPLYKKWQDMIMRCTRPNDQKYPWYGGKGVTVCKEWTDNPVAFINWCLSNGWEPGKQIDKDIKFPGNKIYSPDTCSIVSRRDNMIAVVGRSSGRITSKMKITEAQVIGIVERRNSGESFNAIAIDFDVHPTTISRICKQAQRNCCNI